MQAVIPLSDHPYYLWQALVQAVNFEERGLDATWLIYGTGLEPSPLAQEVFRDRKLFYHRITGTRDYLPSMKPELLGHYLTAHPLVDGEKLLYLDPDVLLAGGADLAELEALPAWSASDTDSYTGPAYLMSKGMLSALAELSGAPEGVDVSTYRGGGAQYVIGDTTGEFWLDVARRSVEAYHYMINHGERLKTAGDPYPVQAWCSEMYVTQLASIRDGHPLTVRDELAFIWADAPAEAWDTATFFHDAGVVEENGRDFCKITWQHSPFHQDPKVSPESASAHYVDAIHAAEARHPELTRSWHG